MRKFKHIIPILLALVVALVIPLAACGSCKKKKKEEKTDKATLQSISLETGAAKTEYVFGEEEFTAAGLVVKASISHTVPEETEVVTLAIGDYTVDSSAFNKDVEGTYPIKVSYTYERVTKSAEYNVEVIRVKDGLEVTLADGVSDTYTGSTAEIDVSKIVVRKVNPDGTVGDVVTDYEVSLWKGDVKVTLTDGKATVGTGVYQIWAERESETYSNYTVSAFVSIYVGVAK